MRNVAEILNSLTQEVRGHNGCNDIMVAVVAMTTPWFPGHLQLP